MVARKVAGSNSRLLRVAAAALIASDFNAGPNRGEVRFGVAGAPPEFDEVLCVVCALYD